MCWSLQVCLYAGDWSEDVFGRRRTCYCQLVRYLHRGVNRLKACNHLGDSYSAGVLLAELATGELPFPGDETLLAEGNMDEDQCNAFTRLVFLQAHNAEWVS